MTTTFFTIWGIIFAFDGALIAFLTWAATSDRFAKYRIRSSATYAIKPVRKKINTMLNNVLSLCIFAFFVVYMAERALYEGWPAHFTTLLGEVLGVLMLYDVMYYFFHRAMHHRKLMKYVHKIHHQVRYPLADESIYLHPAENIGGLGCLLLAIWILAPISAMSFLIIFFIHSAANIIVHSNLAFPHPAFRLFNFWTRAHDVHHFEVKHNYASIFPFWDQLFGTSKPRSTP